MTIISLDNYLASARQDVDYVKTGARTTVATGYFSVFDVAGSPGAGTLAGVDAVSGVVPTALTAGYPSLTAFGGGATGYLTKVNFASSVASRLALFDRLYVAGAFAFNAATALTAQPSYATRCPGGSYLGLQIWVEQVTAATLNQAVAVTYTNENGTTGRASGAVGIGAAPTVGRCWQLPLQAGDRGVSMIESVAGTVASAGTFNVMVLRPLWYGRVSIANDGDVHDLLRTGAPQLYADSAMYALVAADSTAAGIPMIRHEVANL